MRFRTNHGCEFNTLGPNQPAAAIAITAQDRLKGKKLTAIDRLDFFFAGGPPIGGAPRLSIPIDECDLEHTVSTTTNSGSGCPAGSSQTDSDFDDFAFIDALGCNDGDAFVGALRGETTIPASSTTRV